MHLHFTKILQLICQHIVNSTKTYLGLGNSRDELSAVIRALDILQAVASNTAVFGYSMENRIVPRCHVIKTVMSKGLIECELPAMSLVLAITDEAFLKQVCEEA